MRTLGLICEKEKLNWAVLDGERRDEASVVDSAITVLPHDERQNQLLWVYKETLDMVDTHKITQIALSEAEAGQSVRASTLERAQMEGAVMAAAGQARLPLKRYKWASLRSRFGVGDKAAILAHVDSLPLTSGIPKNRHVPIVVSLAATDV